YLFSPSSLHYTYLHSFPTRRSSDLYYTADRVVRHLKEEKDYTIDLKTNQVSLTEEGVKKVERFLDIENLYDLKNITLNHHIQQADRKSTRLNSSHVKISYAVFCLKK